MHLFLSVIIIIIIIMATHCIEDVKPKSSPKKWLIVFTPNYLRDSLERIWDTQCTSAFHLKKLSDPGELQESVSPQPHTSPCTSVAEKTPLSSRLASQDFWASWQRWKFLNIKRQVKGTVVLSQQLFTPVESSVLTFFMVHLFALFSRIVTDIQD